MGRSKKVLDTGAFLNSSFFCFSDAITPPTVVSEVKSRAPIILALVESGKVTVKEPENKYVEIIRKKAEEIGELGKLSETDIDVLALALQEKAEIVSDDFHVQNVASFLHIPFRGVTEEIRRKIVWKKRCLNCGHEYSAKYKGKRCKICGGPLVYSSK